jgi:hypothetical protein
MAQGAAAAVLALRRNQMARQGAPERIGRRLLAGRLVRAAAAAAEVEMRLPPSALAGQAGFTAPAAEGAPALTAARARPAAMARRASSSSNTEDKENLMSVQQSDFQGEILLIGMKWARAGYSPMGQELTAIATALGSDPTVHDCTIQTPPAGTQLGAVQTPCTNAFLLAVNKGKAGNLTNAVMATDINNAIAQYLLPLNTVLPVASGTAIVGNVLTCTQGTWANTPTAYAYQWRRGGTAIGGATASTYTLVSADGGAAIACAVTASNVSGASTVVSNTIQVQGTPVNTAPPVASGTGIVGQTLSCTQGTWSNAPTGYAYQWQRNGVTIAGATTSTYVLVTADGGTMVTCLVTATNAAGSTQYPSNQIAVQGAPSNTALPVASGTGTVGQVLSVTNGTWTNSPTGYTYQWLRAGANIAAATAATYTLVAADSTNNVSCRVTATNAAGSASATSNSIAVA